jgi:hypothetical protein
MNKAFSQTTVGILEQASYSGSRFLFWIITPILVVDSWQSIATLSLINLLTASIYSSIIGGPVFIRLIGAEAKNTLSGYFICQSVIMGVAITGPLLFALIWQEAAVSDPGLVILLFLLPWVSAASDWARKTQLLLNRQYNQLVRNLFFSFLWLVYSALLFLEIFDVNLFYITLAFSLFSAIIYLPIKGAFKKASRKGYTILAPFKVWRHYLITGILAYIFGNAIFWIENNNTYNEFVVLRNYLTPVLMIGLYIENYGAIQLKAVLQKSHIIQYYIIGILVIITLFTSLLVLFILNTSQFGHQINLTIFAMVVTNTLLIALIKIPTVYLRLHKQDHLISMTYAVFLPIWPLTFLLDLDSTLLFSGIEILLILYFILFTSLSMLAIFSRNRFI